MDKFQSLLGRLDNTISNMEGNRSDEYLQKFEELVVRLEKAS
jgi:hypothetical protein